MTIFNTINKGGYVVMHFDHLTTTSELFHNINQVNSVGETVSSMTIDKIMWSLDGESSASKGNAVVQRGANTLFTLSGSGEHDFTGMRIEPEALISSNVVVSFSNTNGHVIIKMKKTANVPGTEY